jgi:hypothetical protein
MTTCHHINHDSIKPAASDAFKKLGIMHFTNLPPAHASKQPMWPMLQQ